MKKSRVRRKGGRKGFGETRGGEKGV